MSEEQEVLNALFAHLRLDRTKVNGRKSFLITRPTELRSLLFLCFSISFTQVEDSIQSAPSIQTEMQEMPSVRHSLGARDAPNDV